MPAPAPRKHLPAHQDLEGVPRSRRQARPHRARPEALPGPRLRLRRVRAARDPPHGGSCWAKQGKPDSLPATYHRTHGVTYFHGCYSVGDDRLWGVNRRRKGTANTLAALKSLRSARPDGAPIYIILDNLSAHTGQDIRRWAKKNKVELCFTPTPPGPTRSGPTLARCGSSPRPTPTTAATPHRPGPFTATFAGETPTPATPTSLPHSARSLPASAARRVSAGGGRPLKAA
ncbi:transposase [Streptomyces brevispora]|uniref:transposase n=1 Tax=Streptomyces brevispora TaxID=887462 RepID=UPI003CC730AA